MTVLTSMSCAVSASGISRPAFADILDTLHARFKSIYGSDVYIAPDSQDGQLLALFAKAIDDANAVSVAVYNSFSPASAVGRALSNNVKINGIARAVATKSTVMLRISGTAGTVLNDCVAADVNGNRWLVPNGTTIPPAGFIDTTAEAAVDGATAATVGTITRIETPILGWQSVTNTTQAQPGAPVELDAALRKRQAVSVALPSKTVLDGIVGAVAAVAGVSQVRAYENDTNNPDANGLPAHSISVVTVGGVSAEIARAILLKKTPGTGTHGSSSVVLVDPGGVPITVRYYVATQRRVTVQVTVKALNNYLSTIGDQIKAAVAAHVNSLGIGRKVDFGRLYVPAQLTFGPGSETFEVDGLTQAFFGDGPAAADLPIAFNEIANCDPADVTVTVT